MVGKKKPSEKTTLNIESLAAVLVEESNKKKNSIWLTPHDIANRSELSMSTIGTLGNRWAEQVQSVARLRCEYTYKVWIVHWPLESVYEEWFQGKHGADCQRQAFEIIETNRKPAEERFNERQNKAVVAVALASGSLPAPAKQSAPVVKLRSDVAPKLKDQPDPNEIKEREESKGYRNRGGSYQDYVSRGMVFIQVYENGRMQISTTIDTPEGPNRVKQMSRHEFADPREQCSEEMATTMMKQIFRNTIEDFDMRTTKKKANGG